mgnify:CR=1 FL=1
MTAKLNADYANQYAAFSQQRGAPLLESDFVSALGAILLPSIGSVAVPSGRAVAACLYQRMSDPALHYHTPLHILSMLSFAQDHGIELEPWQELAVWFHDAVYWPAAPHGENEHNSAIFMHALLSSVVKADVLDRAAAAIEATALHDHAEVDPLHHWILDLDLCNFAWDRPNYAAASQNVAREFCSLVGPERYRTGRREFLSTMLSKGTFYRTALFQSRFEAAARANLEQDLQLCAD